MAASKSTPTLKELKRAGRANKKKVVFQLEDIYETASQVITKKKTGIVYDDRFNKHRCDWDEDYPECPERYQSVIDRMFEYGLVERCERIQVRDATTEEILVHHEAEQINLLESTRFMDTVDQERTASLYDAIYFDKDTYDTALLSAGSAIELVDAVVRGSVQNGMAVIRPPGHHAMKDQFCGYCFMNNVAVAVQHALNNLGTSRVLIVDWDVHHGQATQQMFYEDDRVLYFSIHRYENGAFWPNLRESDFDHLGSGPGLGYNVNIPLNGIGCGDSDYMFILQTVLLPLAYEFNPELIVISAGYDAAVGCPEGQMLVTPGMYHHMTTSLMALAEGKIAVLLEGGYFLPSLSEGAAQTLRALLSDPAPMFADFESPKEFVRDTIYNSISLLRKKWTCFSHYRDNIFGEPDQGPSHKTSQKYVGVVGQAPFPTRACYPTRYPEIDRNFEDDVERMREQFYNAAPVTEVGLVYDDRMKLHSTPTEQHIYENAERITRSVSILSELDILPRLQLKNAREATDPELIRVHELAYVNIIQHITPHTETDIREAIGWNTVFTNQDTNLSATVAAGSLINMVDAVLDGEVTSGVALIRPPGHHAESNAAGGFCIYNNVAIAAQHAIQSRGLKRVLILDFDIHHGNGIQQCFIAEEKVMYISLHRYDNGRFYPNSVDALPDNVGIGSAAGRNVNIAWNFSTMRNVDYISAFTRVILPIAYNFNPELVLVSAGFDACKGDPLGCYDVTPEAFGHFIQLIKSLAGGHIILALEGGYNINSVGYSLGMCCRALLGDPLPSLGICGRVCASAIDSINDTVSNHEEYWRMLLQNKSLVSSVPIAGESADYLNEEKLDASLD
ncbi:Histone deacetylase 6 [Carabus blaptoides fortunei]